MVDYWHVAVIKVSFGAIWLGSWTLPTKVVGFCVEWFSESLHHTQGFFLEMSFGGGGGGIPPPKGPEKNTDHTEATSVK